jgi:hypothetical protein
VAFKKAKKDAPPILGPPVGYVDMLDASLRAKAKEEASLPSRFNPLRPSAAGQCARRLAYEYNDFVHGTRTEAEEKEPTVMRLLDFGSSVEYHGIRLFKQMSMPAIREAFPELSDLKALDVRYSQQVVTICELGPDARVEGSMDLCFMSEKYRAILDFKSKKVKGRGMGRDDWDETTRKLANMQSVQKVSDTLLYIDDIAAFMAEDEDPFGCFMHDNIYQLNAYATTSFIKERGIDHAALLYYSKNDSKMREVRFRPSEEVAEYVKLKYKVVYDKVMSGEIEDVPKEAEIGSARCGFCPWTNQCQGVDADTARKALFANLRKRD